MNSFFLSLLQPETRGKKKRIIEKEVVDSTGFRRKWNISINLAKFLGVHPSLRLSRIDVTEALVVYCHKRRPENRPNMRRWSYLNKVNRNLENPKNKRTILPDQRLSSLLKYEQYKKKVESGNQLFSSCNKKKAGQQLTDSSLKYSTIQVLISKHFLKA